MPGFSGFWGISSAMTDFPETEFDGRRQYMALPFSGIEFAAPRSRLLLS
ncbi:hypothetical protein [Ensifer canadensis]